MSAMKGALLLPLLMLHAVVLTWRSKLSVRVGSGDGDRSAEPKLAAPGPGMAWAPITTGLAVSCLARLGGCRANLAVTSDRDDSCRCSASLLLAIWVLAFDQDSSSSRRLNFLDEGTAEVVGVDLAAAVLVAVLVVGAEGERDRLLGIDLLADQEELFEP